MDISALQARLRSFAAARDWQSHHTPNLAMALTVESAGLLEMFHGRRWADRGEWYGPAYKERVAHGVLMSSILNQPRYESRYFVATPLKRCIHPRSLLT